MDKNNYAANTKLEIAEKYRPFSNNTAISYQKIINLELATDFEIAGIYIHRKEKIPKTTYNNLIKIMDAANNHIKNDFSKQEYREHKRTITFIIDTINYDVKEAADQFKEILTTPITDEFERQYVSDIIFNLGKRFKPNVQRKVTMWRGKKWRQ